MALAWPIPYPLPLMCFLRASRSCVVRFIMTIWLTYLDQLGAVGGETGRRTVDLLREKGVDNISRHKLTSIDWEYVQYLKYVKRTHVQCDGTFHKSQNYSF